MGAYYFYVCLDRQEYFSAGALGGGDKRRAIGGGLESRALAFLLEEPATAEIAAAAEAGVRPGRWSGKRVAAINDEYPAPSRLIPAAGETPLLDFVEERFRDIGSGVALMMLDLEGPALMDAAEASEGFLIVLAELALVHHQAPVARALEARFGPHWIKTYTRRRKEWRFTVPPP